MFEKIVLQEKRRFFLFILRFNELVDTNYQNSAILFLISILLDTLKFTLGKTTVIKAFTLLISSLQIQRINEDIVLQIFELITMKLIDESNQLSPPASA